MGSTNTLLATEEERSQLDAALVALYNIYRRNGADELAGTAYESVLSVAARVGHPEGQGR